MTALIYETEIVFLQSFSTKGFCHKLIGIMSHLFTCWKVKQTANHVDLRRAIFSSLCVDIIIEGDIKCVKI